MLESAESEMVRLISREIIFAEFQSPTYMITIPRRHRRTDGQTAHGQTTCLGNTALRVASRGKMSKKNNINEGSHCTQDNVRFSLKYVSKAH